jgi:squalene-hopene/tetraprenyl-beta-curcumene cyclase
VPAGVDWLLKLQNADGGWPTFCRGWGKLPFDQSCADITAHALRALHAAGQAGYAPARAASATARGLGYLHRSQRPDGSWLPLWFGNQATEAKTNPTIGTARVLMALALLEPEGEAVGRALELLAATQNEDGGWGGSADVASTVEETALAVSALSNWPERMNQPLAAGVAYLVRRVEDGTWTQSAPIGLYFARLWYDERLYPVLWTVEALNRARGRLCA